MSGDGKRIVGLGPALETRQAWLTLTAEIRDGGQIGQRPAPRRLCR
jgi:hypothetical protein